MLLLLLLLQLQRRGLPEPALNQIFCFTGNNYTQLQLCYFFCYTEQDQSTVPQLHAASTLLLLLLLSHFGQVYRAPTTRRFCRNYMQLSALLLPLPLSRYY